MKVNQKSKTNLFFDSFKHFKHNISNLVFVEFLKLSESSNMQKYAALKPTNYKSKLPDLKKIGLINYDKLGQEFYEITEIGEKILTIFSKNKRLTSYSTSERNKAISSFGIYNGLDKEGIYQLESLMRELIFSYYDDTDSIRPYIVLTKFLLENIELKVNNKNLYNILSSPKTSILTNNKLDYDEKATIYSEEIKRPISYIVNFLETARIIDSQGKIIISKDDFFMITSKINNVYFESTPNESTKKSKRPVEEQRRFREQVLFAYGFKCAITGDSIEIFSNENSKTYLLEAAHIIPFSEGGSFSVNNGISLSYELHRLFDRKLFTIIYDNDNKLIVKVTRNSKVIRNRLLNSIDNKVIESPKNQNHLPNREALEYRRLNHLL
jgi:putative restriction endonuclease